MLQGVDAPAHVSLPYVCCDTAEGKRNTVHLYYWFLAATVFLHDSVTLFQREYVVLMSWKMSWNFIIFLSWRKYIVPRPEKPSTVRLSWQNEGLEVVMEFVYLESLMVGDNSFTLDIKRRINLASQRLGMMRTIAWRSRELNLKTKVDLLVSCVFSCLLSISFISGSKAHTWEATKR